MPRIEVPSANFPLMKMRSDMGLIKERAETLYVNEPSYAGADGRTASSSAQQRGGACVRVCT